MVNRKGFLYGYAVFYNSALVVSNWLLYLVSSTRSFWSTSAVDRPEWLTPIPILVQLAHQVGLELEYAQNFHNFYQCHSSADSHKQRLLNMNVLSRNGTISQEEWDIFAVVPYPSVSQSAGN